MVFFRVLFSFLLLATASAETVLLKSGEKVVGKISHMGEREIEMQVPISATIFDTRTISRTDIQEIEQPDPSTPEFDALKARGGLPNSLPSQDYDVVLKKFVAFLAKYPASPHVAEAQQLMGNLASEKQRVISGERKVGGEWFTPLDLQAEKEQVNATLACQEFLEAAERDLIPSLNLFARFEKQYPGAKTMPSAVEKAREVIARVKQIVQGNLETLPGRKAAREAGWKLAAEPQRSQLMAAAASEEDGVKKALAKAKAAGDLWMPLFPNHQISLEPILKTVEAEGKRLEKVPISKYRKSVELGEKGRELLRSGSLDQAQTAFYEGAQLWPGSLMNKRNAELLDKDRKAAAEKTPVVKE